MIAEQVLSHVASVAPGAEAEVRVSTGQDALTRFANSVIHQNVADDGVRIGLRIHHDGRTATAQSTVATVDGLRELVDRTLAAAALLPEDDAWAGLTEPTPLIGHGNHDPDTAEVSPDQRASVVRQFVDAAGGLETAGFCRTVEETITYANSTGQLVAASSTTAVADGIARTGTSDGVARTAGWSVSTVDGAVLGATAAEKARIGAEPTDLEPGRYEVVLESSAVADILFFQAIYGFNARAVAEQRSFVELGAQQFDPAITLHDDPLGEYAVGLPFDAEGTPKRPLTLVSSGKSSALTHDRRTARLLDSSSTGHAIPGGERMGAIATSLVLRPGESDDLVSQVERGLLVTDFWYTRVLDPRTLVVTGLTRNGVWLIEGGKIVRPVRNLRFTQSYVDAFAPGAVLGVGSRLNSSVDSWGGIVTTTPALRLASWNFTGGAAG